MMLVAVLNLLFLLSLLLAKQFVIDFLFGIFPIEYNKKGITNTLEIVFHVLISAVITGIIFSFFTSFSIAISIAVIELVVLLYNNWIVSKLSSLCVNEAKDFGYWALYGYSYLFKLLLYLVFISFVLLF